MLVTGASKKNGPMPEIRAPRVNPKGRVGEERLRLRHQQAAGNDDYDYDDGWGLPFFSFFDIVQGEEPPDTGGGPGLLPRCLFWSSGHC